ncbi:TonB-dependent receptor plug domain-containing protein [Sphingomonas sp. MMS24-JH45]
MMGFKRRVLVQLLASAALAGPAFAQDAPAGSGSGQTTVADVPSQQPDTGNDGDIIVTAQKRDENIQNVPISIQAIGTRRLDQLNVSNFNDYTQLLPSVAFQSSQPGVTTVYMRGVASGGDGNHSGRSPRSASYLDEQPVTIGGTLDVHIYDVARIESLAGPQGNYGASSQAGTIRIITSKPDTSRFEGRVDGEVNLVKVGRHRRHYGGDAQHPLQRPHGAARRRLLSARCGLYRQRAGHAQLPAAAGRHQREQRRLRRERL